VTGSDHPLTPEEEEVRRLLAEARHTGPTPPEVVARLDRVLGDLAQEPDRTAPVIDLARRRRRVASLLVAAAAVVVVGVGLGQVMGPQSGPDSTTAGESGAQADNGLGAEQGPSKAGGEGTTSSDGPAPVTGDAQEKAGLVELSRQHLAEDLTVARRQRELNSQAYSGPRSAARAAGAACAADSWGRGRFVPVSYGGTPAVLVFRRAVGDTQVADLFLCGSEEPVRSVTLPAP
jgi:hypothetical protein